MSHEKVKIKVWDLSTRLFHWGMISLLAALWWTAEEGLMEWHQICAYTIASLLVFRFIWGFIGSDTSQFAHFIHRPKHVLFYVKKITKTKVENKHFGHNPLGGYMVLILLSLIAFQFITGLFSSDDIFTEGPLYSSVSSSVAESLTWIHRNLFYLLLGFASVHVLAVIIHTLKGDKIIPAMFNGYKEHLSEPEEPLKFKSTLLSLFIWACLFGAAIYFWILPIWQSM